MRENVRERDSLWKIEMTRDNIIERYETFLNRGRKRHQKSDRDRDTDKRNLKMQMDW